MQQVTMNIGTICRTARHHTPEVANFRKIPIAYNLLRLYMGRDYSGGTVTTTGFTIRGSNPGGGEIFRIRQN